jgi:hypothetical protein
MPEPRPPHDDADEPEFDDERRARAGDGADDAADAEEVGDEEAPDDASEAAPDEAPDDDADDASDDAPYADDAGIPEGAHKVVFVSTAVPVQISVVPLDDERAPESSALGTYIGERLVARCAMPHEAIERLMELDLFSEPVPLALLAVEEEPGLQCRLFALVPAERIADAEAEDEPWRASVPSFEDSLGDDDDEDEEDDDEDEDEDDEGEGEDDYEEEDEDTAVASILLGHIVRFQRDRKFADDLTAEAVDVLQKIVLGGPLQDANAKAVDDFLNSL